MHCIVLMNVLMNCLHQFKLHRYIKLSSPTLNNVAVIGCILVYLSVICLGLDDATINSDYFTGMCMVSVLSLFRSYLAPYST